ncbi:MAG: helix-turn-helix domain-containing protein [Atopostipes suicloacalis]|nr:helix-turn-helix domain-containing protein [Tetragenococcus koreensis]MDN6540790.1 helix-turn-helix domain-containing protein [Tetragenococcus koreensis]MDN6567372.1 helix-turn-helix domain-containing protein [Tetragenococcus halophilus]MDN6598564.1 helix-turn-helix domain-containing protein [Tetragenococcus koreensis]MDN6731166.1 helix-turn-helix domain-containing protein [Atopostipes suicloacalis]
MKIGERLKKQREMKNWSQQELADKLHISRQSISKWEQDIALPSFANIVVISDLFEISLDELIRGDEELMNKLKTTQTFTPVEKIVVISIGMTVLLFAVLLAFNADFQEITPWLQTGGIVFFIALLFSVDWKKINQALSKRAIVLSIITLVLFLVPFLYGEIISYFRTISELS